MALSSTLATLRRSALLLAGLLLAAPWVVAAQDDEPLAGAPTPAELSASLATADEGSERAELLEAALVDLKAAAERREREQEFQRLVEEAPGLQAALAEELAEAPEALKVAADPDLDLKALESLLLQAEADRASAQATLDTVSGEFDFRSQRLESIPAEVAALRARASELETSLRALPADDELLEARRAGLQAELELLRAEEQLLDRERQAYEVRRDLLPLRRDRAQRQLKQADATVSTLQQLVSGRRALEAELELRAAEATRKALTEAQPLLGAIAARNEELALLRSGLDGTLAGLDRAEAEVDELGDEVTDLVKRLTAARRTVAAGGLSRGTGTMLRSEYEALDTPRSLRADSTERRARLSKAQLLLLELEAEREATGDPAIRLQAVLAELEGELELEGDGSAGAAPTPEVQAMARDILVTQRSLLDSLIDDLEGLVAGLLEAERLHAELQQVTLAYRTFVEERILWVPSLPGGVVPSPTDAAAGLAWLVTPASWQGTWSACRGFLAQPRGATGLWVLAILGVLGARVRLRRSLQERADSVRRFSKDSYRHTALALAETIALALPLPLALGALGWLLTSSGAPPVAARAVGEALGWVAVTLLVFELVRQVCLPRGLGPAHFRWPERTCQVLRAELTWLALAVVPLEFLVQTFDASGSTAWNDAIGRPALWALLVALGLFVHRNLGPRRGALAEPLRRGGGLLQRFHGLWHGLLLVVPVGLAGLSLFGYHYTALELGGRFRATLGFALLLVLVNALLLRWLFLARRRLAVQQARQRAQAKAQAQADMTAEASVSQATTSAQTAVEEDGVDIPAVDAQTRQLIRTGVIVATLLGVFLIWSGAFPALRVFERVQLWPEVVLLEDVATIELSAEVAVPEIAAPVSETQGLSPGALPAVETESEPIEPITLADLFLSLLIFLLMGMAAKNAPGVLEIALLRRLSLDMGSRHAVTTLFRYLILMVGIPAGFGAIGIGWSQVQWLAAALTFGLAFGLQEIFANFVSGLIILIERPVRVGDIVTVGAHEGRITRLRMRSTTLLDYDRREYLIPNREFITGPVVNWTLSDPVIREIVRVGIAYGSDTARAHELLLEVAMAESLVLDDPAPSVVFRSFGESSLDFELRVFLGNRDHLPQLVDRLHMAIDQAFRAASIEIAFPQRDLHLRSMPASLEPPSA